MRTPVKKEAPAIGIDIGTSYSKVGVWQNNRVEIIPNEVGSRTTPSYVAFTDSGRLIGDSAKNQVNTNDEIYVCFDNLKTNDEIYVCFDIDANGLLNVCVEDKKSLQKTKIGITNEVKLSKEEIRRMIKESEKFKGDDDKYKKNVEAKNELETLAYNMKKNVEEKVSTSKVFSSAKKRFVLEAVDEVIQWLDSNQAAEVKDFEEKMKELHLICDPFLS